jgi:hypothetical protein
MALDLHEQRWAKRLARAQCDRDEHIRLLGLISNLNQVVARESSMHKGARAIVRRMGLHLNLSYCALFIRDGNNLTLAAFYGEHPKPRLASWIRSKVEKGVTYSGYFEDSSAEKLTCLPVFNGEAHIGSMAVLSRYELDGEQQRQFKLAVDTVLPVLQTFLLRNQIKQMSVTLPGHDQLEQAEQPLPGKAPASIMGDMVPQFVLDAGGSLLRFNSALERLVGLPNENMVGMSLGAFFVDPKQWDGMMANLGNSRDLVEQDVMLLVQAGWEVPARVSLTPIYYGSDLIGIAGYLAKSVSSQVSKVPLVSLEEAGALIETTGEAIDHMNDLLTVFRSHVQMMLLMDIPMDIRKRLELMEDATMESGMKVRRAQVCVDKISDKCRTVMAENAIWEEDG